MFNPDWEMKLYTSQCGGRAKTWANPDYQDLFYFNGVDYIEKIKDLNVDILPWDLVNNGITAVSNNPTMGASHKSNFFKWSKLATEGGIYSDLDILYFKPIDGFYNTLNDGEYDTAICQTNYLSIGLLASAGNNKFYEDIFLNGFNSYTSVEYQSAGVVNVYNLYNKVEENVIEAIYKRFPALKLYNISFSCPYSNVLEVAKIKYPKLKFFNIPMEMVYPFDSTRIDEAFHSTFNISNLPDSTIGYHWYAGHLISQDFNNILTEENYSDTTCLFSNIVKEICGT